MCGDAASYHCTQPVQNPKLKGHKRPSLTKMAGPRLANCFSKIDLMAVEISFLDLHGNWSGLLTRIHGWMAPIPGANHDMSDPLAAADVNIIACTA